MPNHTFDRQDKHFLVLQRKVATATISLMTALCVFDIVEDWLSGASWEHVGFEAVLAAIGGLGIVFMSRRALELYGERARLAERLVKEVHEDREELRTRLKELQSTILERLDKQAQAWGLSQAENEVCVMLLKGCSFKDIASVRNTSEATVRQQAAAVYRKSALDNRAQLAAYFLEDFLDGV